MSSKSGNNCLGNHLHLINNSKDCKHCQGEKLCLSFGLGQESVDEFQALIKQHGPYAADEPIYRQQGKFTSLFSIQSGAVKTETVTIDGKQSVMGFYLAGDLLGIDAVGSTTYPTDAIALETTWVCEIPYQQLLALCSSQADMQLQLINRLGSKIQSDEYSWKVVRNESAGRRVMYFLHQLYDRQRRGSGPEAPLPGSHQSGRRQTPQTVSSQTVSSQTGKTRAGGIQLSNSQTARLRLPMSKQDLASFLGLTPESFSRTLTQLQNDGYIVKESQKVLVLQHTPSDEQLNLNVLPDIR